MFRSATFTAVFSTCYLAVYLIMLNVPVLLRYAELMLILSPAVILWLVYTVLKYGKHNGTALEGGEFGYQDKKKN